MPELDELMELTEMERPGSGDAGEEQRRHRTGQVRLGSNKVFGYYFELSRPRRTRSRSISSAQNC
jgi:hypothetical protein